MLKSHRIAVLLMAVACCLAVMAASAGAATTIKFSYWGTPVYNEAMLQLVSMFQEENPDIKVETVHIPSKYYDKLLTMIAGGDAPDVAMLAFDRVPQFVDSGALQPIDTFVTQAKYPLKDLYPVVVKSFTRDGKLYGLPRSFSPFVLFYNEDMVKAAGIKPSSDWKWADFRNAAMKLTDNPGRTPYGFASHFEPDGKLYSEWLFPFIWQNGGDVVNPKTFVSEIAEPAAKQALAFYTDLIQKDKVAPTSIQAQTFGGSVAMFLNQRAAMITDAYNMAISARTQTKLNFDVVRLPYQKERASVAFPIGYVIPKQAKNAAAAFKLLSFLGGPKGQRVVPELGLGMPGLRSIAESNLFLKPGEPPANARIFLQEAESAQPLPANLPKFQEWYEAWRQNMEPVLAGTAKLDDVIDKIDKEINRIIKGK